MDKMILVDLETQSFAVECGIYEVACLVIENFEIVDQLYLGKEIPGYDGERIYGFGFYDISEDEEEITKFKNLLCRYPYPIVAHNCPFDRKFLNYYEWIPEDYPTYCSMRAIRLADNTLESYALKKLVKYYGIGSSVKHTAFSDVMQVYEILKVVRPQTWLKVGEKIKSNSKYRKKNVENIDINIDTTELLKEEVVCFTGKSVYSRNVMKEIVIKNGGQFSNTITKKTTVLVVGLEAGSKLDKAQEKEISIISDDDFMKMLNLIDKQIL